MATSSDRDDVYAGGQPFDTRRRDRRGQRGAHVHRALNAYGSDSELAIDEFFRRD
jgi:hypothetical protein